MAFLSLTYSKLRLAFASTLGRLEYIIQNELFKYNLNPSRFGLHVN